MSGERNGWDQSAEDPTDEFGPIEEPRPTEQFSAAGQPSGGADWSLPAPPRLVGMGPETLVALVVGIASLCCLAGGAAAVVAFANAPSSASIRFSNATATPSERTFTPGPSPTRTAGASSGGATRTSTPAPTTPTPSGSVANSLFPPDGRRTLAQPALGERAESQRVAVTAKEVRVTQGSIPFRLGAERSYYGILLAIANGRSDRLSVPFFDFRLRHIGSEDVSPTLTGGDGSRIPSAFPSNQTVDGWVWFQAPAGLTDIEIRWAPSFTPLERWDVRWRLNPTR